jgi:hypothetical protein
MVELMEIGAGKLFPEGVRGDRIFRLTDTNVEDGIVFEITVSSLLLRNSDSPNETTTQTWKALLSPNLAREIAGRWNMAAGGIDKSGETHCPTCHQLRD